MSAVMSSVFGAGVQLFNNTGAVLAGGKIYTYTAGTLTSAPTWTDSTQLTQNANPIILDSTGRMSGEMWIANNSTVKLVVTDANGNPIGVPWDNVPGVNSSSVALSEWVVGPTPTYVNATTFTVLGNQAAIFTAGRRVQYSITAGTFYGTVTSSTYNGTSLTTVVIAADSTGLSGSLSAMNYGFLNASPSSVPVSASGAVTASQLQNQSDIAFTTTGTSTAFALTPTPAIAALSAGQAFCVTFNVACGASPTMTINGYGPVTLVKRSSTGGYVALAANDVVAGYVAYVVVLPGATQAFVSDVFNPNFNNLAANGTLSVTGAATVGSALSYSDTGTLGSFANSTAGYNQVILQNLSSTAAASTSYVVSNDAATATTGYAEFGINSSVYTGTGSFNLAGAAYLASATTDLVIGTYGNNAVHFVLNSGATDAMELSSTGLAVTGALSATGGLAVTGAFGVTNSIASGYTTLQNTNSASTGYAQYELTASVGGVSSNATFDHAPGVFTRMANSSADPIQIAPNNTAIGTFSSTGLAVVGTLSATGNMIIGGTAKFLGTSYNPFAVAFAPGSNVGWTNATDNGAGPYLSSDGSIISMFTSGVRQAILDANGNLGLGVVPSAWSAPAKAIQISGTGSIAGYNSNEIDVSANIYYSGGYKYLTSAAAASYQQNSGSHSWYVAPSGTAGSPITFTQAMTLDVGGDFLLGTTSTTPGTGGIVGKTSSGIGYFITDHASGTATGNYYSAFSYAGSVIGSITQNLTTGIAINGGANLSLTGTTVTAPTPTAGDNSTNVATTAFVATATASTQIQSVSASIASNALTVQYSGGTLSFRNATSSNGSVSSVNIGAQSLTIPSGATLGTVSGVQSQLVLLEVYNGGSPVLGVINIAGGVNLDETTNCTTTAISSSSNSATAIYTAAAVSGSPFRVIGTVISTQSTAGTWATSVTTVQGAGGQAMTSMQSLGYGQTWQNVFGSRANATTYYNTTSRPILVSVTTGTGSTTAHYIYVNGVTAQQAATNPNSTTAWVSAIVPPGASYSTSNNGTMGYWAELR